MEAHSATTEGERSHVRTVLAQFHTLLFDRTKGINSINTKAVGVVLHDGLPLFEQYLQDPELGAEVLRCISCLALARESTAQSEEAKAGVIARRIVYENRGHLLQRAIQSEQFQDTDELFLALDALQIDPQYNKVARTLLADAVARAGFDYAALQVTWAHAGAHERENALRLLRLEHKVPGLPKALNKEFGVTHFSRYPEAVLIRQYELRNRTDVPYGILLNALYDHNGALQKDSNAIDDLACSIRGQYELRIIECESKVDIGRKLQALHAKYTATDKNNKIQFAVIGGHGNKNEIAFGNTSTADRLLQTDLAGKGFQRVRDFFIKSPIIIVTSCRAGESGGIAQELSSALNATVYAPTGDVREQSIKYDVQSGRFTVMFSQVGTAAYGVE